MDEILEEIRRYQAEHAELMKAHHFVFAVPTDPARAAERFECVVIGVNPGEASHEIPKGLPLEESWGQNFRDAQPPNAPTLNWRNQIDFFAGGRNTIQTEFFFWSSFGLGKNRRGFRDRYGELKQQTGHLHFCKKCNLALVDLIRPDAVIAPGITHANLFADIYELKLVRIMMNGRHRLIEHYLDNGGRPWIFTKHWTGSFGFSGPQREVVKNYIQNVLADRRRISEDRSRHFSWGGGDVEFIVP